ncbi:histone-lysine N-methyltransferase SETMAR-like [Agrilus planipennis]|uniref:Histone-lysine N-methyltransferase SETMAR-like n=1 Tax=Agrilus planipennis TaxID=224129 RepID=A0A7F5R376_AGRPL|nr:histone-lysine N-methyltransferase SETMAR-like [Agrilus planipennis]
MSSVYGDSCPGKISGIPSLSKNSMQWNKKGTPPPKKFKVSESAGKIVATVFWEERILLIDYKDKDVSTEEYNASILERLKEVVKEKRRGKSTEGVLPLYDNVPVHKSRVAMVALQKVAFEILAHPPYCPDLVPSNYYHSLT